MLTIFPIPTNAHYPLEQAQSFVNLHVHAKTKKWPPSMIKFNQTIEFEK